MSTVPPRQNCDSFEEIEAREIPYWYPTDPFGPHREMWRRSASNLRGITRVCDFYTKRNLWALAALWAKHCSLR